MDETYTSPPKQNEEDNDYTSKAAEASRRLEPNYTARRAVAVAGIAAAVGGGVLIGQHVQNEANHDKAIAVATAEYNHNQAILQEIHEKALEPVDPADVKAFFRIRPGATINGTSIKIAAELPEYENADETTKKMIDYTLLESGKAQGTYNADDKFVISETKINGIDSLVVQDGTDVDETTLFKN